MNAWLNSSTWYSSHGNDVIKFNQFVGSYVTHHGYSLNEASLQDKISFITNVKDNDLLYETIISKVSLMYSILNFMKDTNRQ